VVEARGAESCKQASPFAPTRWSLIVVGAGGTSETSTRQALTELCEIYWRPIFAFISRAGHSREDAEDLTQDFFAMILEGDWLQRADQKRGRFRSFLLTSVQNFLHDAARRDRALKRGGERQMVSWDDWIAEVPSQLAVSGQILESSSPEQLFDFRWAATVVEQALRRLREECESHGRLRVFDTLSPLLTADRSDISYATLATNLGIADTSVKKLLHNMRQRFRRLIRDEVAQTVESSSELDDELRHLCSALASDDLRSSGVA
jgi:RNA polymerase sigma factor (sigma-70 family)